MDYAKLVLALNTEKIGPELFQVIVNAPFDQESEVAFMYLGIIVLLLVDVESGTIDRIAMSDSDMAKDIIRVSNIPFEDIRIPLGDKDNIIARAIKTGKPKDTTDWRFIYSPVLKTEEAHINQASSGVSYSAVYPLKISNGGALIFSYFQFEGHIGKEQRDFMKNYTDMVADTLSEHKK